MSHDPSTLNLSTLLDTMVTKHTLDDEKFRMLLTLEKKKAIADGYNVYCEIIHSCVVAKGQTTPFINTFDCKYLMYAQSNTKHLFKINTKQQLKPQDAILYGNNLIAKNDSLKDLYFQWENESNQILRVTNCVNVNCIQCNECLKLQNIVGINCFNEYIIFCCDARCIEQFGVLFLYL